MALIVDPRTMKKYSFFSRKGLLIFEKYSIEFKSLYKKYLKKKILKIDIELIQQDNCEPVNFGFNKKIQDKLFRKINIDHDKTNHNPGKIFNFIYQNNKNSIIEKTDKQLFDLIGEVNVYKQYNKNHEIKVKDLSIFKTLKHRITGEVEDQDSIISSNTISI